MSLFSILAINGQALNSFQKGIDLTNKNVDNLDNKDYSRERAIFDELPGYGVTMTEAHRIFDQRYFDRFIHENQRMHYYKEASNSLDNVQTILNDIQGSGISKELNSYYNALNDIVSQPENIAARTNFLEKARLLVSKFKTAYNEMENEKENLQLSIQQETRQINDLTKSLAKINKKLSIHPSPLIIDQEEYNTLLNQRDKLIKQISSHIDTKVRYNSNGTADIFTAKGHALVLADRNFQLSSTTQPNTLDGNLITYSIKLRVNNVDLSDDFSKGSLTAKLHTQNIIDESITKLNKLAIAFANRHNDIHTSGYDLENNPGGALFGYEGSSLNISTIKVAIDDPKKVAAATATNEPSNNENAKAMLETQQEKIATLNNRTFHDYYSDLVAKIGAQKSTMDAMYEQSHSIATALDDKIQSISGVNLDEELVRLTQLQRAYQASARVLGVTDKLLETVMNIVR